MTATQTLSAHDARPPTDQTADACYRCGSPLGIWMQYVGGCYRPYETCTAPDCPHYAPEGWSARMIAQEIGGRR